MIRSRTRTLPWSLLLLLFLTSVPLHAQLFNGMNYQAVLRDAQGDPMTNQAVTLTFNVHQSSAVGPIVFTDTHNTSTNDRGLVNVVIGKGAVAGSLTGLDYAGTDYYLVVYVNGSGLPPQRLEAVPMSFKATNMDLSDIQDVSGTAPTNGQVLQWDGTTWAPSTVAGGLWTQVGNNALYDNGEVIIGDMTPVGSLLSIGLSDTTIATAFDAVNAYHGDATGFGGRGTATVEEDGTGIGLYGFSISHSAQADSVIGVMGTGSNGLGMIPTYGLLGRAVGASASRKYGVFGNADGASGVGVFGLNLTASGHAGWFKGRVGVDDGPAIAPASDASALLQLNSTTRGFLLPRMTTTERTAIASPAEALLVYDIDLAATMQYVDGSWQLMGGGAPSPWTTNTSYGIEYDGLNVGIGIDASDQARLAVVNDTLEKSVVVVNSSNSPAPVGLHSIVHPTSAEYAVSILGAVESGTITPTDSIVGVFGTALNGGGQARSYGVLGQVLAYGFGTARNFGLAGQLIGSHGAGVFGELLGNGTDRYAIHAKAYDGNDIALFAENTSGMGVAGYFAGELFTDWRLSVNDELWIRSQGANSSVVLEMNNDLGNETISMEAKHSNQGGASIRVADENGSNRILLVVDNAGVGRVTTDELEIKGGADLAEHFAVDDQAGEVLPGTLVSIAPDGSGRLEPSVVPYDRRVAGVVSGANGVNPGLTLRQPGTTADGAVPVALNGRVYVRADVSNGPIAPGDLLTSSTTPGRAMKATDTDRMSGAVIGKAMTALDEGTGLVLVLVNLQ
ncbi:MAG: hypothetical protein H6594_06600 [Flavobacteriales bacterium]|nr:hypothetical protein [Flavobacteriales bacterium]